jgi:hypothetical protein
VVLVDRRSLSAVGAHAFPESDQGEPLIDGVGAAVAQLASTSLLNVAAILVRVRLAAPLVAGALLVPMDLGELGEDLLTACGVVPVPLSCPALDCLGINGVASAGPLFGCRLILSILCVAGALSIQVALSVGAVPSLTATPLGAEERRARGREDSVATPTPLLWHAVIVPLYISAIS